MLATIPSSYTLTHNGFEKHKLACNIVSNNLATLLQKPTNQYDLLAQYLHLRFNYYYYYFYANIYNTQINSEPQML